MTPTQHLLAVLAAHHGMVAAPGILGTGNTGHVNAPGSGVAPQGHVNAPGSGMTVNPSMGHVNAPMNPSLFPTAQPFMSAMSRIGGGFSGR